MGNQTHFTSVEIFILAIECDNMSVENKIEKTHNLLGLQLYYNSIQKENANVLQIFLLLDYPIGRYRVDKTHLITGFEYH